MGRIRVAIAGVGNCASALVQGVERCRGRNAATDAGLVHEEIGGFKPSDVEVVAAFDADRRKVRRPLEEAVFAAPNRTRRFQPELPANGVTVRMGPVLDGIARREPDRFIGADGQGRSDRADGVDRGEGDGAAAVSGAGPGDRGEARPGAAGRPGEGS